MMKRVRRSGFTLPEVLVTVTVVAVLAAVVVPAVTQYTSKADTPSTQQDLTEIRNAITAYYADTRTLPATIYDLTATTSTLTGWKGPYLQATVTGNTSTGYFTSGGLGIKLGSTTGGALTKSNGYLTTDVVLVNGTTCQDLYNLDKYLDGGSGATSTNASAADATNGALTWNNTSCALTSTTAPTATLRLVAVGS